MQKFFRLKENIGFANFYFFRIQNVFDFGDAQAKEIMIPRVDVDFIDINAGFDEVMEVFKDCKHTRLPVYEDNIDNIVGIVYLKDFYNSAFRGKRSIEEICPVRSSLG